MTKLPSDWVTREFPVPFTLFTIYYSLQYTKKKVKKGYKNALELAKKNFHEYSNIVQSNKSDMNQEVK